MDNSGTVTISLDLELAWGMTDMLDEAHTILSDRRHTETQYLDRLLELCDRHRIPITFAAVGHLFAESVDDIVAAQEASTLPIDPETLAESEPLFCAPELPLRIQQAATTHDIGTHTLSHVICDAVEPTVVDRELRAVAELYDSHGLDKPRSFVAPRNWLPNDDDVLRDNGIDIIRASEPAPAKTARGQYAVRLKQWLSGSSPTVGPVQNVDGMVKTYARPYPSMTAVHLPNGQRPPPAPFRAVPLEARQRRHYTYLKDGLEHAIKTGSNLHIWTHLYNLSNDAQWAPIQSFLETVAAYRDEGLVRIETMSDLASRNASVSQSDA